jgi:class 3 adenylate cyclase
MDMDIVIIFKSDGAVPREDHPVVAPAAHQDQPRIITARLLGRHASTNERSGGGLCRRAEGGCFVPVTGLFRAGRRRRARRTDWMLNGMAGPTIDLSATSEEEPRGEQVERRLAAILVADVVGYSRLMGKDEIGTLALLRKHHSELIGPKVSEHKGRIVRTAGDGFLVEFQSVVEAVACAIEIQLAMADRNAGTPQEQRIVFRIGINLDDIIIEDREIHGDGVNIAARLEPLAEPGGICVSAIVHDAVRDKFDLIFDDMGEQVLKNIARTRRVYRLLLGVPPSAVRASMTDGQLHTQT